MVSAAVDKDNVAGSRWCRKERRELIIRVRSPLGMTTLSQTCTKTSFPQSVRPNSTF